MDQFYTNDNIASRLYDTVKNTVDLTDFDLILEPSAGKGAFFKLLPPDKRIGIDIEPKYEQVVQQDFFEWMPDSSKKYMVIGNPPFGRICSIAIKFFNHASTFATVIAFLVPRTFKRVSVQNKLNAKFRLVTSEDLPVKPCCFEPEMDAKCCFQIWKRCDVRRELIQYNKTHKDFKFLKLGKKDKNNQPTPPDEADFVIKAYGSNCGEIVAQNLMSLRPKSWHWIKSNINVETLKSRFEELDYSMSDDTVRQSSIGQQEVIFLYEKKFGD